MSRPPINWQFQEGTRTAMGIGKMLRELKDLQKIIANKDLKAMFDSFRAQAEGIFSSYQKSLDSLQSRENELAKPRLGVEPDLAQLREINGQIRRWQGLIGKLAPQMEAYRKFRETLLEMRADLNSTLAELKEAIKNNNNTKVQGIIIKFEKKKSEIENLIKNTPKSKDEADKIIQDMRGLGNALPRVKPYQPPPPDVPSGTVLGRGPWILRR